MYGVTVPRTVTICVFRNKGPRLMRQSLYTCQLMQKMTPEQIVYSVRGISNSIELLYDNLRR